MNPRMTYQPDPDGPEYRYELAASYVHVGHPTQEGSFLSENVIHVVPVDHPFTLDKFREMCDEHRENES